jgi:DNA-binding transcriptional MerR regulator
VCGVTETAGSRGVYSIGAVARMVDVPVSTLRAWEERYELVRPRRSEGGQRLYSRDEVDQLRFIKQKLEQGLSPAEAHRLLEERMGTPERRLPRGQGQRRLVILLAEQDPYAADLAEYFLHTEGYDVSLSWDVEEARRAFEDLQPDLTILDWLISGGVGAELCQELKRRSDRPILVLSSLDLRDAALHAGADAFLQKPLEPLSFVSTVKDLVGDSAFARRGPDNPTTSAVAS